MANKLGRQLSTAQRKNWQITLQNAAANRNHGAPLLIRVVIDSNVWISALLFGGKSESVVRLCLARVEIIASETIAEEIYDYLKNKTKAPQKWRRFFRNTFEKISTVVPTRELPDVVRDPKDNHVVAVALETKSKFIVTGDKDLLELNNYHGVRILSPAKFLDLLS